jgi:hypothetical protein
MGKRKGKSNKFVYINRTDRVKIRFVGEQVEMFQYFNKSYYNGTSPSVFSMGGAIGSPSSTTAKPSFFREHDDGDEAYNRTRRIVSLVIDRSDEKIKAFACPISVWNKMTDHVKENDFEIWKDGVALQTRYSVEPLGLSDVTDAQEETIAATLNSYTFADIFVKNEWELVNEIVERIEHRWQILDIRED